MDRVEATEDSSKGQLIVALGHCYIGDKARMPGNISLILPYQKMDPWDL